MASSYEIFGRQKIMSIRLIELTFRNKVLKDNRRLAMLALADNASDQGYCWPSYATIADKINVTRRSAIRIIQSLEEDGYCKKTYRMREDGKEEWLSSNGYQLNIEKLGSDTGVTTPSDTGVTTMVTQESLKPSVNRKIEPKEDNNMPDEELIPYLEALGLSTTDPSVPDLRRASTMRSMEVGAKNSTPRLEGFPPDVSAICQEFANAWGFSPTKKQKSVWIKEAREWLEMGVKVADIARMIGLCKERGMSIKGPYSITWAFYELPKTTDRNLPDGI